jgi:mannose-6-phosphate isomerase-like protein (cupin superfamily)
MVNASKFKWGYEMVWADTKLYSARTYVINEGEQTSYVYHKKRDKTIFILKGTAQLIIEGKSRMLTAGQVFHIPPKLMHRIIAIKQELTMLEVGTQLEDDVVIVEE